MTTRGLLIVITCVVLTGALMLGVAVEPAGADAIDLFIARFYSEVLDREPDPQGLAAWNAFLRVNCTQPGFQTIADSFFDSEEFRTTQPLSLPDLITKLYVTYVGRDPDPAGLAAWMSVMRQTRLAIASGFVRSAEFQSLLPDPTNRPAVEALVTRLYDEILGRAPDPEGLNAWVDQVISTGSFDGLAQGFLASPEFENHPQTFRDYITTLYRTFLGREPDPAGLDAWEAVLRQALLRVINQGFVPSPEFQAMQAAICGGPVPDVRGVYQGNLDITVAECTDPADNGQGVLPMTVSLPNQGGAAFSGSASTSGLTLTPFEGIVVASGNVTGTFSYSGTGFSGRGIFYGAVSGLTMSVSIRGRDRVGGTCRFTGTFTGTR